MSNFKHSIVLFTGEDGLPLEFNVRNTADKTYLKALIEYGGGFCTQNENAVHLISPGTKVLNVDTGKKLVSSSYIYDCVKENYLLDVNDYVFTIAEAGTSDISEENSEDSLIQRQSTCKSPKKITIEKMNFQISPIKSSSKISLGTESTTPSSLLLNSSYSAVAPVTNSSSTHSESFVEGTQEEKSNVKIISHIYSEINPVENCKSFEITKSPSKLYSPYKNNNSPSKRFAVDKQAILSSPLRCLPFSDNPKGTLPDKVVCDNFGLSPKKIVDQILSKSLSFPKSPVKDFDVSPKKCFPIHKEAILSSPIRRLSFSDKTRGSLPMELCGNTPFSPKKLDMICPNVMTTFAKSPVKDMEVNLSSDKSPNVRENFTLKPVNELFRNSPSPIQFNDQLPEYIASPEKNFEVFKKNSPLHTIVSSSQPEDDLDNFDNMLLSKIQKKPLSEDEESLSQSFTVSSSADAQVSSKPCSSEANAPELSKGNEPDSPSLISSQLNVPLYMKNLEDKVEQILKQTPPLSIQDKIAMVKYICCVRKLPPASVLNSLFTNSLDL